MGAVTNKAHARCAKNTIYRPAGANFRLLSHPFFSAVHVAVGYEFTVYTTTEGQGLVELCAVISDPHSGGPPLPFELPFTTEDGSAGQLVIHCSSSLASSPGSPPRVITQFHSMKCMLRMGRA